MSFELFFRLLVPAALALGVAFSMDRMCAARGLLPPGFREPWRRALAAALVALILWIGAFSSLGSAGEGVEPDLSQITTPQLFFLHFLLILTIGLWFLLGFAGVRTEEGGVEIAVPAEPPAPAAPPPPPSSASSSPSSGSWRRTCRRRSGSGSWSGSGAWGAVLAVALVVAGIVMALGGEDSLPKQPPALMPWIAALPVGVKLLISLSAGVVEETFFRGFLQPRIGVLLSTLLFVFAHFSYGQPFMLVGITTSVVHLRLPGPVAAEHLAGHRRPRPVRRGTAPGDHPGRPEIHRDDRELNGGRLPSVGGKPARIFSARLRAECRKNATSIWTSGAASRTSS